MPFKPNYRFDRAERARSKEAKKMEKLEAQAARRKANRDVSPSMVETHDPASAELSEDHDGFERADEKKG
jgi:hypothetical protein